MISLFNKKSIAAIVLALSLFLMAGCSNTVKKPETNLNDTKSENVTSPQVNNDKTSEKSTLASKDITDNNKDKSKNSNGLKDTNKTNQDIAKKVKDYIINGQGNKPEADKIKWSKTFLNKVDIDSLYKQYTSNGGNADDIESFAKYITQNAPIPGDWEEMFKKDLYDAYGEKVVKLEHLKDDLYQAYIVKDGSQIPYVVVSSRTGYYHG